MIEPQYERKGCRIRNLVTHEVEAYRCYRNKPSINAAKRASRKLQEARGGLGRGLVAVWRPAE